VSRCFFASDIHGRPERYTKLWRAIAEDPPGALFLGGDLLPSGMAGLASPAPDHRDFVNDFMARGFEQLRARLGARYPRIFLILGNDDDRFEEAAILDVAGTGLWTYVHDRCVSFGAWRVFGYACVPPTPFQNKDWERYDVSRYVDPGCVSPEEGWRSVPVAEGAIRYGTIEKDLARLLPAGSLDDAILLVHTPPYDTLLDRVANDGKMVDHVPLDLHAGSIALRRLIASRQPRLSLHGHIHESARLSGSWRDRIGDTHLFGAAHDGEELALIRFDLEALDSATRDLL
jgi:Icc-related predicted phosphoesterase